MSGNSFGQAFRITTAGESHGPANVVIIDGCPPGLALSVEDLRGDLARRRPGQSRIVTQRMESDEPEILSGVFEGKTTGTPIAILIRNQDAKSRDYADIADKYRPGHADYTYDAKYGRRDYRGGGRASARETVARVAAGAVAKKLIAEAFGGSVVRARQVMHGKTSPMHHRGQGVFAGLPQPFEATRYHSLIVAEADLPAELAITAWTEHADGSRDEIMGLKHRELPIEGVQFHPESILTRDGKALLKNFLESTQPAHSAVV